MYQSHAPIGASLVTALAAAKSQAIAEPPVYATVVLLADGGASGCSPTGTAEIAGLAAESAASAAAVRTFVVGMGPDAGQLDLIAKQGGSGGVLDAAGQAAIGAQLGKVRDRSRRCAYRLDLDSFDQDRLNVHLVAAGKSEVVPRVPAASDCGKEAAWHYNDQATPTTVVLCDGSCPLGDAEVELSLGCPTEERP